MKTEIIVDNLKCGGCANTIKKNVSSFDNIEAVDVNTDESKITITHSEAIDLDSIKSKLDDIGYPETGTTHGIDKLATNIKSYVSCAIGKLNTETDKSHS